MPATTHISTSGGLISTAFIENIRQAQTNQRGTQPDAFGLPWQEAPKSPAALEARIAETWEALLERWDAIATDLPAMDISQARDRWILPLLRALDFQPIYQRSDIVVDDSESLRFNISHFGWEPGNGELGMANSETDKSTTPREASLLPTPPPIHTVLPAASLDARPAGAAAGRSPKGKSPHDMVQLFLNVSRNYRWAILTNGVSLRLLRDYHHTYTKGYVEFDLESIFETRNFADFRALYRLAHASRFTAPAEALREAPPSSDEEAPAPELWDSVPLEMFYRDSQAAGIQVGADLQKQVREAIETLGNGFLLNGGPLLQQLQTDPALCQTFYSELLHIVYRILFLLYAEQRGMVPHTGAPLENLYRQGYSLTALRARAENDPASPEAYDLWEGLKVTFKMFQKGAADLGVYRYNGMLFAEDQTPIMDGNWGAAKHTNPELPTTKSEPLRCRNYELLLAIRALTLVEREGVLQRISYADLNVEEIGGIYESLLDFAPRVTASAQEVDGRQIPPNSFFLDPRGTARKTTGSYYTHPSLVNALIESALIPVLNQRVEEAVSGQPEDDQLSADSGQSKADGWELTAEGPALAALTGEQKAAAEKAILNLKVCDPAGGSGHFLIAANNALALLLAQVRTGDDYPAERELRQARRDVLAHCIYGVDLNPMAVELCKVALWINAAVDDAPLSFLDHHLKNGNSLIGATPELLKEGIPGDAFQPVTGDDSKVASAVRKRNKQEREGQLSLWRVTVLETESDLRKWRELNELAEDEPQMAERCYAEYRADPSYRGPKLVADLWTAAFFWPLDEDNDLIPTEELFRQAQADPGALPARLVERVAELADYHRFFHWHLEFPDVFEEDGKNGFDVVLGNPPWEKIQVEEKHFFAGIAPEIANAPASIRKKLIKSLAEISPDIFEKYVQTLQTAAMQTKFLRFSNKYPLTGKGNVSTHSLFIELGLVISGLRSRIGLIVPSGLATQYSQKDLYGALTSTGKLRQLFDFENRKGIFPGIHRSYRFCVAVIGPERTKTNTQYAFDLEDFDRLIADERTFELSYEDLLKVSPNTLSCPAFKNRDEANIISRIYQSSVVLLAEDLGINPWGWKSWQMFNETHEASELHTWQADWTANNLDRLYEAKLVYQFDHRYATYEDQEIAPQTRYLKSLEKQDPYVIAEARYCVSVTIWQRRMKKKDSNRNWIIAFRRITNSTNERTSIFTVLPRCTAGSQIPAVMTNQTPSLETALLSNLNSLTFDFVTRSKVRGTDLNHFIIHQLPVIPPDRYTPDLLAFIVPRVLELTYTAWDLRAFADDIWAEAVSGQPEAESRKPTADSSLADSILQQWEANGNATDGGHEGAEPQEWAKSTAATPFPHPPFKWDEERRAQLRADLDGLYGHLYGLSREELAYILDTFPIVRRKDEAQYGEYRTKRMVLEAYDRLGEMVD